MLDLIVVGAGPVGSHLAKRYAEKGNRVIVIERSDEIGQPLACSGHVSPDIWSFVPEEARDRLYQNQIYGARFHTSKKDFLFEKDETVSYVIDRVELDKVKAEEAMTAGAEYRLGETVKSVREKDGYVEIETDKDTYKAKMVAGCDGAQSTVRSQVGLPDPDHFYQGILCFTEEDDSTDHVDVYTEVPNFFGWRIPRGDTVEYGAAVPRGENPVEWLEYVTGQSGITEAEQRDVCAGAIPIGPSKRTVSERTFLVGDAAGQTKPFTGGGILYGMRSADIAAQSIDLDRPETLQVYEKAWRSELLNEIRIGGVIEKSYSMPEFVQHLGMWMFQGEIGVHMDKPTTLFSLDQLRSFLKR